jgi:exodeoxyribonuclease VII large subunit
MTDLPQAPGASASNIAEFSVSELSARLKRTVEDAFGHVRVRGEISGFKRAASGHLYMSLKDADAVLDAVCWRGVASRMRFRPEDGLEVVCTGKLTTYAGRSKYQLVIESMEPAGVGALMALLEERRRVLAGEGLFAEERKRPIPYLPDVVGVVTSPTGAVIRDILHRLGERFPRRVLLWPVLVQGETAADQVAAAIRGFNALQPGGEIPRPDVLIVARGGGSIEDLWAFNEEVVVRAAAESQIPLISAVGHETDTTLIDFASDRRAPTPTAAAEIAVPVKADLVYSVLDLQRRLAGAMARVVEDGRKTLAGLLRGLRSPQDMVDGGSQRLDDLGERLQRALVVGNRERQSRLDRTAAGLRPQALLQAIAQGRESTARLTRELARDTRRIIDLRTQALATQSKLLETLSYQSVLKRGYAVVREPGGGPLTSAAATAPGMGLDIQFHDGHVDATVSSGGGKPAPGKKAPARRKTGNDEGGQGSLL